jgi:hypothetical protein
MAKVDAGTDRSADAQVTTDPSPAQERQLSAAARRALAEAAERRAALDAKQDALRRETEHRGRGGLDPVRYDDWEIKGLTSDF